MSQAHRNQVGAEGGAGSAGSARSAGHPAEQAYWRSFAQLQRSPEFLAKLEAEFPEGAGELRFDEVSRRNFLGIMAASVAMAGMTSCRKPKTEILPFAKRPEDLVPGIPRYYATSHVQDGIGIGTLVRSSEGRPTKVEGNPLHPSSGGASNTYMQGELLNLYDPARSAQPVDLRQAGKESPSTLAEFLEFWQSLGLGQGEGLRLLLEPTTSPSTLAGLASFQEKFPKARVHGYAPINRDETARGTELAFGKALDPQYRLDLAKVVVSFDHDFLGGDGDSLRNSRDYAKRRKITSEKQDISRLYAVEGYFSLTGSNADHRFRLRARQIGDAVMALAHELGSKHGIDLAGIDFSSHKDPGFLYNGKAWIPALAKDLADNRGRSCLMAGPRLPAEVQAVLHLLNFALGNAGKTVRYTRTPPSLAANQLASIGALTGDMDRGLVKTLVILGGNPVYTAPADLDFKAKLEKVETRIHLSQFVDETSRRCSWHVNQAHELEAWGDICAHDGTASVLQPLIAPLYDGISCLEMLAMLAGAEKTSGYDLVREHWAKTVGEAEFDKWWARTLHDGLVSGSAYEEEEIEGVGAARLENIVGKYQKAPATGVGSLEVQFRPSYAMHDGRYANNAWLMELPDPMTKLVWDNAALMSLPTARELKVKNGDVVLLVLDGRWLRMPVWILPGHADHSITLTLGYGRDLPEQYRVARGAGFDTYKLRGSKVMFVGSGLSVQKTGDRYRLATTQEHGSMQGRALVRENSLDGYRRDPGFAPEMSHTAKAAKVMSAANPDAPEVTEEQLLQSLWKPTDLPEAYDYSKGYQWGMAIDLNSCVGCSACVTACTAENNIPTVGKAQILKGREMNWLRVDRYFGTSFGEKPSAEEEEGVPPFNPVPQAENPQVVHQIVPCMHCEKASCEVVCPVAATLHSPEGLNDMAYNRCIGTRYCANNCPYKVRRFNYLDFHGKVPETTKMVHNPYVTVRNRGVMEKCTYCVQRINANKIAARKEGRRLEDGEFTTACAQSCPTEAIKFGNINDPDSEVAKLKKSNLNYSMLSDLNTRPRTSYLAKIRNPNKDLT